MMLSLKVLSHTWNPLSHNGLISHLRHYLREGCVNEKCGRFSRGIQHRQIDRSAVTRLERLPCSLLELKYLNISPCLKTFFFLGTALSRSAGEMCVWCRWTRGCSAAVGALSLRFHSNKKKKKRKKNTVRWTRGQEPHVKGLYLGEKWLPGARQHAGPVERPVPGPFPHHLRIVSLYGEFDFLTLVPLQSEDVVLRALLLLLRGEDAQPVVSPQ